MPVELKGWKTGLFFVLALLIGIANLVGFADFELSAEAQEWAFIVLSIVGLILRHVTTTRAAWRRA